MHSANPKRKITRNSGSSSRRASYRRGSGEESSVSVGSKAYQKAIQSRDKYQEMAREALSSGDRVMAEGYFQHADHYNRIINTIHETAEEEKVVEKVVAAVEE